MRHDLIIRANGATILRRTLANGRRKFWGGREYGWIALALEENIYAGVTRVKVYSHRSYARKALRRILAHERELGLHGWDYAKVGS